MKKYYLRLLLSVCCLSLATVSVAATSQSSNKHKPTIKKIVKKTKTKKTVTKHARNRTNRADLMEIYTQARANDPLFQEARASWMATREAVPQSVAALLPVIEATTTVSQIYQTKPSVSHFNSHSFVVTLTQPLINFAAFASFRGAHETAKQAAKIFIAAKQDLIIRTAQAYLNVLLARDNLRFTKSELRATNHQLNQAQQRYKVGLVAITAVYEARAAHDLIIANKITAENTLVNTKEQLRQLTGRTYQHLVPLKSRIPLLKPIPANGNAWVKSAEQNNLAYLASKFAAKAAIASVDIARSGHLPTLNLTGNFTRSFNNNPTVFRRLDNANKTASLVLTLPIFSGGNVLSLTRQAHQNYKAAIARREQAYRTAIVNTRQGYNNVIAGISRVKADRETIKSQRSSLKTTEAAHKVGTRTIVDVLQNQRDLYNAQRQHSEDQNSYINNILELKRQAGVLCIKDLAAINRWLR